jgi:hypothetical protein
MRRGGLWAKHKFLIPYLFIPLCTILWTIYIYIDVTRYVISISTPIPILPLYMDLNFFLIPEPIWYVKNLIPIQHWTTSHIFYANPISTIVIFATLLENRSFHFLAKLCQFHEIEDFIFIFIFNSNFCVWGLNFLGEFLTWSFENGEEDYKFLLMFEETLESQHY